MSYYPERSSGYPSVERTIADDRRERLARCGDATPNVTDATPSVTDAVREYDDAESRDFIERCELERECARIDRQLDRDVELARTSAADVDGRTLRAWQAMRRRRRYDNHPLVRGTAGLYHEDVT